MNPKAEWFFNKSTKWKPAYLELRNIILDSGLSEELKWGVPCYTHQNANIVLIHGFKDYCALLFHKGVLLKDEDGKHSKTREARIEKYFDKILEGKGIDD
jgi:uncharacterized protein YdeI (YjbR/CyaY-like superfamily)